MQIWKYNERDSLTSGIKYLYACLHAVKIDPPYLSILGGKTYGFIFFQNVLVGSER